MTLEEFAEMLKTKGPEAMRVLEASFHAGLQRTLDSETVRRSPIKRSKGSRPAGAFLGAWGSSVGAEPQKEGTTAAAVAAIKSAPAGTPSHRTNYAAHALVLEYPGVRGDGVSKSAQSRRRRGKSRAGSRYGSPQAPGGVARPAIDATEGQQERMLERAIRDAEEALR